MYADGYIEKEKFQRDMDISRTRMSELELERRAMDQEEQQREELRLVMGRIEEFGGAGMRRFGYQRRGDASSDHLCTGQEGRDRCRGGSYCVSCEPSPFCPNGPDRR